MFAHLLHPHRVALRDTATDPAQLYKQFSLSIELVADSGRLEIY